MTGSGPGGGAGDARCGHCGGVLSLEDLSQPACRYCGSIHAHVARAAEKVAIVHGLMGGALVPPPGAGRGPSPILPGVVMPGAPPSPPMAGGPVPIGSPPGMMPGPVISVVHPQAGPAAWGDAHAAAVMTQKRVIKLVVIITVGCIVFFTLLALGAVALLWGLR